MFKLAAEPKRWMSVTLPASAAFRFKPACLSRKRVMTRCTMRSTEVSNSGCAAKRDRKRQHPLPDRHAWDHLIDQAGSRVSHAPRAARRAKPTTLTGKRDHFLVGALGTAGLHLLNILSKNTQRIE